MNLRIVQDLSRSMWGGAKSALEEEPITQKVVETLQWLWDLRHEIASILITQVLFRFIDWLVSLMFGGHLVMPRPHLEVVK